MSVLTALEGDVKKVFSWLGSSKGQAVIAAGEAVIEDAFPAATGAINLANTWVTEIFKADALAEGAAATGGTADTTKAAAVISVLTPQVLAWAAANKLPVPKASNIQAANDALVTFLEALGSQAATS